MFRGLGFRRISVWNESRAILMTGNYQYIGGAAGGVERKRLTQTKCPSVSSGLCAKVLRTFCDENTVTSGGGGGGGGGE